MMVFTGHTGNAGHFLQPTASAMGHRTTPFSKRIETTSIRALRFLPWSLHASCKPPSFRHPAIALRIEDVHPSCTPCQGTLRSRKGLQCYPCVRNEVLALSQERQLVSAIAPACIDAKNCSQNGAQFDLNGATTASFLFCFAALSIATCRLAIRRSMILLLVR